VSEKYPLGDERFFLTHPEKTDQLPAGLSQYTKKLKSMQVPVCLPGVPWEHPQTDPISAQKTGCLHKVKQTSRTLANARTRDA
jgi:hypothetical protein